MSRKLLDLTGQVFGRLTVIEEAERDKWHQRQWVCQCSCGSESTIVKQGNLRRLHTQSCGCLVREVLIERSVTHGMRNTRQYRIWAAMKIRCTNPNEPEFVYYGGRGITYDHKWDTFEGFWEDMKDSYEDTLTLDRINPNGDYTKENCRWVTQEAQSRNKRMMKNNTSGHTGVHFDENGNRWRAEWAEGGQKKTKSFSFSVWGERAKQLAIQARKEAITRLNEQGAGYTETHGL